MPFICFFFIISTTTIVTICDGSFHIFSIFFDFVDDSQYLLCQLFYIFTFYL